jgi:hypothetical protein
MTVRDHLACEQSPNCMSTVSWQHVKSKAGSVSKVKPDCISTVTTQHVNSAATVEMQSKDGFSGGIAQRGFNLAGEICRCDLQHGTAASCAAAPRSLVFAVVYDFKNERQNHKGSVANLKESRS